MGYRLTEKAADDLLQMYVEGIHLFGEAQAACYHARMAETFELLSENPKLGRERRELEPPVRVHPCGSHIIIYLADEEGILVLRVRHSREDWENREV